MARGRPLTTRRFLIVDGVSVPWDQLTQEQIDNWRREASERLSRTMSLRYSQHPEEYAALCAELEEKRREKETQPIPTGYPADTGCRPA